MSDDDDDETKAIATFLSKNGLAKYLPKLIMHDFDSFEALEEMDEADMAGKVGMSPEHAKILCTSLQKRNGSGAKRAPPAVQEDSKRQKTSSTDDIALGLGQTRSPASTGVASDSRTALAAANRDIQAKLAEFDTITKSLTQARVERSTVIIPENAFQEKPSQLSQDTFAQRSFPSAAPTGAPLTEVGPLAGIRAGEFSGLASVPLVAPGIPAPLLGPPFNLSVLAPKATFVSTQGLPPNAGVTAKSSSMVSAKAPAVVNAQQAMAIAAKSAANNARISSATTDADAVAIKVASLAEESAQTTLQELAKIAEESATICTQAAAYCVGEMERAAAGGTEAVVVVDVPGVAEVAESAMQAAQCASTAAASSVGHAEFLKNSELANWAVTMHEVCLQTAVRADQSAQECAYAAAMLAAYTAQNRQLLEQHQQQQVESLVGRTAADVVSAAVARAMQLNHNHPAAHAPAPSRGMLNTHVKPVKYKKLL